MSDIKLCPILVTFTNVTQVDIRPMSARIPNLKVVNGDAQKDLNDYKKDITEGNNRRIKYFLQK